MPTQTVLMAGLVTLSIKNLALNVYWKWKIETFPQTLMHTSLVGSAILALQKAAIVVEKYLKTLMLTALALAGNVILATQKAAIVVLKK